MWQTKYICKTIDTATLRIKILEAFYTNLVKMIDFNDYMLAYQVTPKTI